jgi:hypothetical protein
MIKRTAPFQLSFFPLNPREYAKHLGLNWWAIKKLYDDGWLSFDPETTNINSSGLEAEFTFLCNLIAEGCDPVLLKHLLKDLKKPYAYRFGDIYYDWQSSSWKSFPEEKSVRALLDDLIEEAIEEGDKEVLIELQETIESAIAEIEEDEIGLGSEVFDVDPKIDPTIIGTLKLFKKIEGSSLLPDNSDNRESLIRIMDAVENIPIVSPGFYEKLTLSGPVVKASGWEINKWWEIEVEMSGAIRIAAQGYARSPQTGGDSYTALKWEIEPGMKPSILDHSPHMTHVPTISTYPADVEQMDLEEGYELEFIDKE